MGRGTDLMMGEGKQASAGADGTDMTIKRDGKVPAFDDWTAFINPVSEDKAVYCKCGLPDGR